MRKILLVTALGLSASLFSATSHAADTGFYAHANIGQTNISGDGGLLADDSDTAYGIGFGWRFLPWLAVEAGYNKLGDYRMGCGGEVCPAVVFPTWELDSVELGLAARVPFGDNGMFGQARLGMHNWDVGYGGSETDPYYGVGVGYSFNDRFSLSLNYDVYRTNEFDVGRAGLGLEVAF